MRKLFIQSKLLLSLVLLLGVLLSVNPAHAMVEWRISVKIFRDAAGNLPSATNTFNYSTPARIRQEFTDYNRWLDRMGRGFRFQLTEIVELSGSDGAGGNLSRWFNVDARNGENRSDLEVQAKLHPGIYAYRPSGLNVYVNGTSSGVAAGAHLPLLGDVIFAGAGGYWTLIWHEINHALGLCHTHGCGCNDNCVGVSDDIPDTINDSDGWDSWADIARGNFGTANGLTQFQRNQVEDVWQNLMSYHNLDDGTNLLSRLTHDQWQVIIDVSNLQRRNVTTGKTIFVDRANGCLRPEDLAEPFKTMAFYTPGWSWGTRQGFGVTLDPRFPPPGAPALPCPPNLPCSLSICLGGPFKNLKDAVNDAVAGDRLQIKAATYAERVRITKRLTLTTDRGTVRLGAP